MLLQSGHFAVGQRVHTAPAALHTSCHPVHFPTPFAPASTLQLHKHPRPNQQSCSRRTAKLTVAAAKGFGAKVDPSKLVGQTCPCGSKVLYRECCEPYHAGRAQPATADVLLRSRFCAFIKGEQEYIVNTFHPQYLAFKYPGQQPGGEDDPADMLKRDVRMACNSYDYSSLRILKVEPGATPDETFIEFSYKSSERSTDKRTRSRNTQQKAAPVERNLDGSVKVNETVERSRFVRDNAQSGWRFADYELISFPERMAEAKEAELKSRQQMQQGQIADSTSVA